MRAKRIRYHLLVMTVGALLPAVVHAQQTDSMKADSAAKQQQYEGQRGALMKELQETQDKLSDLRSQRVQLEARIENVLAETMQKRTQQLLVSKTTGWRSAIACGHGAMPCAGAPERCS